MSPDPVRDEAERLVAAAIAGLSLAARSIPGAGEHALSTGSAECCVCPLCRVIAAMRDPDPDLTERLATGAGDLATAVAGALRTFTRGSAGPSPTAEHDVPPSEGDEFWEGLRRRAADAARRAAPSGADPDPWRQATAPAGATPMARKTVKKATRPVATDPPAPSATATTHPTPPAPMARKATRPAAADGAAPATAGPTAAPAPMAKKATRPASATAPAGTGAPAAMAKKATRPTPSDPTAASPATTDPTAGGPSVAPVKATRPAAEGAPPVVRGATGGPDGTGADQPGAAEPAHPPRPVARKAVRRSDRADPGKTTPPTAGPEE